MAAAVYFAFFFISYFFSALCAFFSFTHAWNTKFCSFSLTFCDGRIEVCTFFYRFRIFLRIVDSASVTACLKYNFIFYIKSFSHVHDRIFWSLKDDVKTRNFIDKIQKNHSWISTRPQPIFSTKIVYSPLPIIS